MDQQHGLLGALGAIWMGLVLVVLIVSGFIEGPRAFLETLGLTKHLLYFWGAMLPGVVLALLAEKKIASGGS